MLTHNDRDLLHQGEREMKKRRREMVMKDKQSRERVTHRVWVTWMKGSIIVCILWLIPCKYTNTE